MISGPITQERAVTKAEVLYERGVFKLDVERRLGKGQARSFCICVPADEALVSFSNDPRLTSSVFSPSKSSRRCKRRGDRLENAGFDDRTHHGVHTGAISAGSEGCELHFCVTKFLQDLASYILLGEALGWGRKRIKDKITSRNTCLASTVPCTASRLEF